MDSELDLFVRRCEGTDFRNRRELLEGIQSGEIVLESHRYDSDYSSEHFLRIYQRRAEYLKRFQTEHSERLRADVLEFVGNLVKYTGERITSWGFTRKPNITYSVFECIESKHIVGCIKVFDKRLTPAQTWNDLWGVSNRFQD